MAKAKVPKKTHSTEPLSMSQVMGEYFKAADGSRISDADVQLIANHFKTMSGGTGDVTPEQLLRDAQDKTSPLHRFYEWDNKKAAHQYRLIQAANMIRAVHIVFQMQDGSEVEHRGWLAIDTGGPGGGKIYKPTPIVFSNVDYTMQIIAQARRDMESCIARYEKYAQLADMVGILKTALTKIPAAA